MRVTQKSRRLTALIGATTAAVAALPVFVGAGVASASTPGAKAFQSRMSTPSGVG